MVRAKGQAMSNRMTPHSSNKIAPIEEARAFISGMLSKEPN